MRHLINSVGHRARDEKKAARNPAEALWVASKSLTLFPVTTQSNMYVMERCITMWC